MQLIIIEIEMKIIDVNQMRTPVEIIQYRYTTTKIEDMKVLPRPLDSVMTRSIMYHLEE